jgi:nicotinamide-nucleotide amidase
MLFPADIESLAEQIIKLCTTQKKKIVTAESCTGGLVAAALTHVAGSSAVVERGFVTYSNDSKTELLAVMPEMIEDYGAVSPEVAEAMAKGALEFSLADIAVSVTGIAGPGGATADKPVGLVYLGLTDRSGVTFHYQCMFKGSRETIRMHSVHEALKLVLSFCQQPALDTDI